jgi:hypothetical protein
MAFGALFTFFRLVQILSLIPAFSLLTHFINLYDHELTPTEILTLFIVTILAAAWALISLVVYRSMHWTPPYVWLVDVLFIGALMAGVILIDPYVSRGDCIDWTSGEGDEEEFEYYSKITHGSIVLDRQCMMMKAAWGMSIANTVIFAVSAVLAWNMWHRSSVAQVQRGHERAGKW